MFKYIYKTAHKNFPKISQSELDALNSGSTGFDREIFSGSPKLEYLNKFKKRHSEDFPEFMEKVKQVCEMIDDHEIHESQKIPDNIMNFLKEHGFFGMIIPKELGGKGFSPSEHSEVVQMLSTRSVPVAVTVMVPNSLGPAELLMKYGTEEQRNEYLPKLASGEHIPCFALTSPHAGSDATSIPDQGIVVEKNGVLGVEIYADKRYITLAPIASLIGMAFQLKDPQGLLGDKGKEGITLALIEKGTDGLETGRRHKPMDIAFMNGPVKAQNLFIPLSQIIGGQEQAGSGWKMLMECLTEGRGISLPAQSMAAASLTTTYVGAYSRIRKQFKTSIANMEGVQEKIAENAILSFKMLCMTELTNSMLDSGEKPPVITAIMKYHMTESMRKVVNNSMDIVGGAGICKGPNNLLANCYQGIPIGITVEGANILTRSMMIFGQGASRSHQQISDLFQALSSGEDAKGFYKTLFSLGSHVFGNAIKSLLKTYTPYIGSKGKLKYFESEVKRFSNVFAYLADLGILSHQSKLKTQEYISGKYGDILSELYISHAILWYASKLDQKTDSELIDVAIICLKDSLNNIENRIIDLANNNKCAKKGIGRIFNPLLKLETLAVSMPFAIKKYNSIDIDDIKFLANQYSKDTSFYRLFKNKTFVSSNRDDQLKYIVDTFLERHRFSEEEMPQRINRVIAVNDFDT